MNTERLRVSHGAFGWFDSVAMRHARRVSGISCLSLNLLDVLTGLKTVKICTSYKLDGKQIDYYPASLKELERCEPVYEELRDGMKILLVQRSLKTYQLMHKTTWKRVSELSESPLATVSVGADRIQTIIVKDPWELAHK